MAITGQRGTLYTVPNSTFYQQTGEDIITITDTTGNISQLQQNIDQTRAANPGKLISIRLYVNKIYNVTTNALTLSSNMVIQGLSASIIADPTSTAKELIKITDNSTNVSICNLILDGKTRATNCITGNSINRCNIDALTISNALSYGITLSGISSSTYDNENTITRCNISSCTQAGIDIVNCTQAICMDNVCGFCSSGISFYNCSDSTIINNNLQSCTNGLIINTSNRCAVANNYCNVDTYGIVLDGSTSAFNKIVSNNITNCTAGIYQINGASNIIYDNTLTNNTSSFYAVAGTSRIITTSTSLCATGQNYFFPPTVTNRHSSLIKNSTSRTDVTNIDTSLSNIFTAYKNAKASNPNNVIVMNLTAPIITGNETITLSSNSCFVLSGSILLNSGVAAFSGKNVSFVSFSGGTLSGQNTTGRNGITLESCSYILIDQMRFNSFGDKNIRVTGSEPIKLEGCLSPTAVGYCTINEGAARGIWMKGGAQSTSNLILTDNTINNLNMDGIDFDVTSSGMLAKFNNCNDNIRYGIFAEEGADRNQVLANTCSGNEIAFNIFSNVITGTINNSFIANKSISNQRGIRFGATSTKTTSGNFAFNNSITSCVIGIDAQNFGSQNYCSQNYLYNNTVDLSAIASAVFFNSPFLSFIGTRITANGVYQSTNYFDEITYASNKIGYIAVYSSEFDEVSLQGVGGGLGKRESNDGKVYVTGSFDEVTPLV